jgi:Ca2+-binding EF-hand superfamily protein
LNEFAVKFRETGESASQEQLVAFFNWLDMNHDGKIEFHEWFRMCARMVVSGVSYHYLVASLRRIVSLVSQTI